MKIKMIKQFGAAIAAVLIIYGIVATTFRSYEEVMAAQVEIPPAIVVKNTTAEVVTETVAPVATAAVTPVVTTTETTTETASVATPAESTTIVAAAAPTQEVIVPDTSASTAPEQVVTEPVPIVPSLSEFLSQFRCGGCGKNCSLVNPRCNVGAQKAQQAESEYYATYS